MQWALLEWSITVVLGIIIITQVIVPSFSPRLRYFWAFRKSQKKLRKKEGELAELAEKAKVVDMDNRIRKAKKAIGK